MHTNKTYEYKNEFLFFILRPDTERGKDTFLYCSGVNVDRFLPITKGRHRPMSNPAIRGLQLVNLGVRALALEQGATPKALRGNENQCAGIVSPGDIWITERLLIENAPEALPDKIIGYGVTELLKKFDRAIMLQAELPDKLLDPPELQVFLEGMCTKYGGG
jgi:hypothetical protein